MRLALMAAMLLLLPLMTAAQDKSKRNVTKEVDALFRDFSGGAPGASVLVLRDGKVVLKKSYGYAHIDRHRKASPKTNFRLASVSKQFTAMCILLLAERGQLSLDDPVKKFFSDFPAYGEAITVRHLLNHTSGLPAYEDHMPPGSAPVVDADVFKILKDTNAPYFAPGTQFRYSNSGYALLALIVEEVSGQSFPEFLQQNIFKPLKMRNTHVNVAGAYREDRRAYGYSRNQQGWELTDQSRTSYVLGDGGIYSSVADLEKWVRSLDAAPLVRAKSLRLALSATVSARPLGEDRTATGATDEEVGYGYGWYVSRYRGMAATWHGGSSRGFRNHLLRIPEKRLTVIVLTNRSDADAAALARRVADLVLGS